MTRMIYERDIRDNAAWSFETARFFVGFYAEPEDMDPEDSFEREDDIAMVRNGEVEWFHATVRVYLKSEDPFNWVLMGRDDLGACAYETVQEFYTNWRTDPDECRNTLANKDKGISICHYFPDMVRSAVEQARRELQHMQSIPIRHK